MRVYSYIIILLLVCVQQLKAQVDTIASAAEDSISQAVRVNDSIAIKIVEDSLHAAYASENGRAEELSYRYYLSKEWNKLLPFAKQQFKKNNDYYYLRMRAGIAAYEMKQYRQAAVHFKKALFFKPFDEIASEYLYFAFLFSDRSNEALQLRRHFTKELKLRTGSLKSSVPMMLFSETGLKTTTAVGFDNAIFSQVQFQHSIGGRFSLLHSGNYFSQNEKRFSVEQAQYYLRAGIPLKKGFELAAAVHVIQIYVKERVSYTTTTIGTSVFYQPPPSPPRTQTFVINTKADTLIPVQNQSYIAALALSYEHVLFACQLGGSYAALDTATQMQVNLGLQLFPLKNNHLIFGANLYLHKENSSAIMPAIAPYIVWRPFTRLYLNANWFTNAGNNISEYTAQLFTNSIDYTRQRYSASLYYGIKTNLWLYGSAGYELKTHFTNKSNYAYSIFSAGLKITFL